VTDSLSPTERSARMALIRHKDTKPERLVRRAAYALGYRYRLHGCGLPGRPDLVFCGRKKVIFVHGCFWHQHPSCKRARMPKSRMEFWEPKLRRNRERDLENQVQLQRKGWRYLVVWECEIHDRALLDHNIAEYLESP
jgi:DNA mismatch endonuclease, patch repair protein